MLLSGRRLYLPDCSSQAAMTASSTTRERDADASQPGRRRAAGGRRLDTTLLHAQALISVITALVSFVDRVFEMLRSCRAYAGITNGKGSSARCSKTTTISGVALAFWHV